MHPTLVLSVVTTLVSITSALPSPVKASVEGGVRLGAFRRNSGYEQVDEDDVARSWGGLSAGVLPLFSSRWNATASTPPAKRSAVSNPKVVINPKFAEAKAAAASASSAAAASASAAPTTSVGYTSSGLDLDGTHTGQATWFDPGLGACGTYASSSDYIVAVSHLIYDTFPGATPNPNNNPICGRKIAATYQGKTVTVLVQDECMNCDAWNLDFSPIAFQALGATLDDGRLYGMTWTWV
ncbi:hypothetical protein T439DRAFT_312591 [Meredithblackwellia eburnea MCA 4105]